MHHDNNGILSLPLLLTGKEKCLTDDLCNILEYMEIKVTNHLQDLRSKEVSPSLIHSLEKHVIPVFVVLSVVCVRVVFSVDKVRIVDLGVDLGVCRGDLLRFCKHKIIYYIVFALILS